jgi:hypothetical protein
MWNTTRSNRHAYDFPEKRQFRERKLMEAALAQERVDSHQRQASEFQNWHEQNAYQQSWYRREKQLTAKEQEEINALERQASEIRNRQIAHARYLQKMEMQLFAQWRKERAEEMEARIPGIKEAIGVVIGSGGRTINAIGKRFGTSVEFLQGTKEFIVTVIEIQGIMIDMVSKNERKKNTDRQEAMEAMQKKNLEEQMDMLIQMEEELQQFEQEMKETVHFVNNKMMATVGGDEEDESDEEDDMPPLESDEEYMGSITRHSSSSASPSTTRHGNSV